MIGFNRQLAKDNVSFRVSRSCIPSLSWMSFVLGALVAFPIISHAQVDAAKSSTTFLVVRHAERNGNADGLTKAGERRAQLLSSLGIAMNVNHIYSTDTRRTKGTVQPLATAAGIELKIYRRPSEKWIASLKKEHAGQVVLIVGHSNTAGVIAALLANCETFEIGHDEYDALFIVQASDSDTNSLRLKYGDSEKVASSAAPDKMGEIETIRDSKNKLPK